MSESIGQISDRVRECREISGLSVELLAGRLNIPVSEYLQYESGSLGIPISLLYELAGIFKVELTELLTGLTPKLHSFCLVKNGEATDVERYKGYKFQSLAYNFANKKIEPLLVTIEPEENKKMSLVTHPGQEFNYVLEGCVRIILGGKEIDMSVGDSIYFDPMIPHGQTALDGKQARFLTVILHDN